VVLWGLEGVGWGADINRFSAAAIDSLYFAMQTGSLYIGYLHSLTKLTNRNVYFFSVQEKYEQEVRISDS
jgi:hypothetical protein